MDDRADVGLHQVLSSAAAAVGVPEFQDALGLGDCSFAVVCLIDGLGASAIERFPELFPSLEGAGGGAIRAAFPTTTATGLVSLGTGLTSGMHGVVGAAFWLPDLGEMLFPLRWGSEPAAHAVQPEVTVFEVAQSRGVRTVSIGSSKYAQSGLTRAAFRGSEYVSADDPASIVSEIRRVRESVTRPTLIYAYWPAVDRAGHEFGESSSEWRLAAAEADRLITAIRSELPTGGQLIVTADHGMLATTERVWIENHPELLADVSRVGGEPRMRHLYTDHPQDVVRRWRSSLGDRVSVHERQEALAHGWFGDPDTCDPLVVERIGDVLVLPAPGVVLASKRVDELVSNLPGQHGGRTEDETRIPAMILGPVG